MAGSSVCSVVDSNARSLDHEHDRQNRVARQPIVGGSRRQHRYRNPREELTASHDQTPVIAVGDMTGHQHKQRGRDELREPNQPEIERVMSQTVHLPAHGDCLHLQRNSGRSPRQPKKHERLMTHQRCGQLSVRSHQCLSAPARDIAIRAGLLEHFSAQRCRLCSRLA
jgi:hypothetical protein